MQLLEPVVEFVQSGASFLHMILCAAIILAITGFGVWVAYKTLAAFAHLLKRYFNGQKKKEK